MPTRYHPAVDWVSEQDLFAAGQRSAGTVRLGLRPKPSRKPLSRPW
jgi:hypothetical protein